MLRLLAAAALVIGHSTQGRPITAVEVGDRSSPVKVLVVGCIHGTECAGLAITRVLEGERPRFDLWIVPNLNPDGFALGQRTNGRGVDLNRNFPSEWREYGRRGEIEWPGPRPSSEPETRIAERLIARIRPRITIWFHQHMDLVRAWGPSVPAARRYARLSGLRFRRLAWPSGSATSWQNHRFPGTSSFVVELPAGRLTSAQAHRFAAAVIGLPQ